MEHQVKLAQKYSKIALLVDAKVQENYVCADLLAVFAAKNIEVVIVEASFANSCLLQAETWQDVQHAFIATTKSNQLSFGYIQSMLDIMGIKYTGCNMLAAALSNDLVKSKKIWQVSGIATSPFTKCRPNINWQEIVELFGLPLAVKSRFSDDDRVFKITQMGQVNVFSKFNCLDAMPDAMLDTMIVEPWLTGDEYWVYIVDGQPLLPLFKQHNQIFEADVECSVKIKDLQSLAINASKLLDLSSLVEVKILQDLSGDLWVLSTNCLPKIDKQSKLAMAAFNSGISFDILVEKILSTSLVKRSLFFN